MTLGDEDRIASRLTEDRIHHRYVEKFRRERGYLERRSDPTNNNSVCMDSFGLIAGRPVMIELKMVLACRQIRVGSSSGSIESKLHAMFEDLHRKPASPVASWLAERDRDLEPLVVVAADSYRPGAVQALTDLLEELGQAWSFGWEIWQGCATCRLLAERAPGRLRTVPLIERKPDPRQERRATPSQEQVVARLHEQGAGLLFEHFRERVIAHGGQVQAPRHKNINVHFRLLGRPKAELLFSVILEKSRSRRLHVGFQRDTLRREHDVELDLDALPGEPETSKGGTFAQACRLLHSNDEIDGFLSAILSRIAAIRSGWHDSSVKC